MGLEADDAQAADDTIDTVDATAAAAAEPQALTEVEELAVDMGWKPLADYTGPQDKWKPAKDYVKAERDVSRSLRDTVKGLKDTVERMATASTRQTERALKLQAEEINTRWEKAVEDGDHRAARAAEKDLRELEETASSEKSSAAATFARENPWYGTEPDATDYAASISERLARQGKSVAEQLEAAAAGVKKRFPELFEDAKPASTTKAPPGVNAPQTRAPGSRQRTGFADMPPDARAAGDRYAALFAQKFGGKVEDYRNEYATDYFANKAA